MDETTNVPVSRSLVLLGSLAIVFHLGAVIVHVLAAPSGPWPVADGVTMATPPQLAYNLNLYVANPYLTPLKLTHNYHFPSNRPGMPGAFFEVILKDAAGKTLDTVRIPDPNANMFTRHRQELLARALADDVPVTPPPSELIAGPNQKAPEATIWDPIGPRQLQLRTMISHLIPRDRPVFRPSDWSLVLARAYVRHLCRETGAARGELVRHTKDAIPPLVLFIESPASMESGELLSSFGESAR